MPLGRCQTGAFENGQMPRECRRFGRKTIGDFHCGHTVGRPADQQAKGRKPGRVRKRGKGIYGGVLIHASRLPEITKLDKPEWWN